MARGGVRRSLLECGEDGVVGLCGGFLWRARE